MIRHSSSFIISLILHALVLTAIFFVYTNIPKKKASIETEKKLKISLCNVSSQANKKKPLETKKVKIQPQKKPPKPKAMPIKPILEKKKKTIPKKIIPKKAKKIIQKIKPKPIKQKAVVEEEKTIVKKPEPIKQIPITQPEIITQEEDIIIEEPIESTIEKEKRLEQEYINKHIKKITQLLSDNLYYPRSARRRNIQGNIMVKFKLSTSAKVFDIEIISSNSEILSRAAIKTIEDLSDEFPAPPEELLLHVPITYKLSK